MLRLIRNVDFPLRAYQPLVQLGEPVFVCRVSFPLMGCLSPPKEHVLLLVRGWYLIPNYGLTRITIIILFIYNKT